MAEQLASFVGRLFRDKAFRSKFVNNPDKSLKDEGLDTGGLALPAKIDEQKLMEKLEAVFSGSSWHDGVAPPDIGALTPDALWERFGIIGSKTTARDNAATTSAAAVVTVVVVYGVSVVTSGVVVAGRQIPAALRGGVLSVNQLKTMRELGRAAPDSLSFSIQGPDGVAVHDLGADALGAFLDRLTKRAS